MQNFAYQLYNALGKHTKISLIKWGGSNKYLPIVLPYFFLRACWVLLRGGVDVVHVQDGVLAPIGYVLSRLFRLPFTVIIHGLDITYNNKIFQTVNVWCVRRANLVFCISQSVAEEAIKKGVSASRVRVIPVGMVDKDHDGKSQARVELRKALELNDSTLILLTVGRLVKRKGVAWFIANVLPQLVKIYPSVVYVVVGRGEEKDTIDQATLQNRLSDHVKMVGLVDDDHLPMFYKGADVFVQPNITVVGNMEGFGMALLEASLNELPVVATGIEGITDAITNGKNGILVAHEKDADAFVAEISPFLNDPKLVVSFGQKSRAFTLARFDWGAIAKRYIEGYQTLVEH